MWAMVIKEFRELVRDRRTVALLLVIPFVLLIVFGYAANFSVDRTRIVLAGPGVDTVEQTLKYSTEANNHLEIVRVDTKLKEAQIETLLRSGEADAVVFASHSEPGQVLAAYTHLWVDGSFLFAAQAAEGNWMRIVAEDVRSRVSEIREDVEVAKQQATQARVDVDNMRSKLDTLRADIEQQKASAIAQQQAGVAPAPLQLPDFTDLPEVSTIPEIPDTSGLAVDALNQDDIITVVFNPDLKTSWVMVPGLIGLILTFVGTLVTSIGLVRERETGTLEQLAVMPLRPSSIIAGKIAPYFLIALFDAALITTVAVWLFNVPFRGSIWRYCLLALVFVFVVLGLGVLISVISQNTGQAIQLAIMAVMPQVLLSGLIFPLKSMDVVVRTIGYLFPLTWFYQASNGIMLKDATLTEVSLPMGILLVQAAVMFSLATIRMSVLLRHGGATK